MDLGDVILMILDILSSFIDVECFRFWRFFLVLSAALALAGCLDWVMGDHVPGRFLYIPLGLLGAIAGSAWELLRRKG